MKQIRFALLRHGVTTWNAEKRIQGRTDISITPETASWYRQHRLPTAWRDVPWMASPLARTRETADALGLAPIGFEPSFIEMDWPILGLPNSARTRSNISARFSIKS